MDRDGDLAKVGRTPEMFDVIAKHGDRAANFIWRNKGTLLVASTTAAFLANPEPFLDGTVDVSKVALDGALSPIASAHGKAVIEAANSTDWTAISFAQSLRC